MQTNTLKSTVKGMAVALLLSTALTVPAFAADLPGEGVTVNPIKGNAATTLFQELIVARGLEALGYEVSEHAEAKFPAMHLAIAGGDADYTASHWEPLHNAFYDKSGGDAAMTRLGHMVTGAGQGYLIDKATAEAHNITNIADMKNPEIAALFDTDGDGKANLIGCDPGWGCEKGIENHLDAYELRDAVNHDQGSYFALIADGIARYKAGEPVLYYTWTPMWLGNVLVPGEDTVWLDVPFSSQPGGGTEDTSTADGRNTGFLMNEVRILANNDFLAANPAAAKLFELVSIPIDDINNQNALVNEGQKSFEEISGHVDTWIANNQATFDGWVAEAAAIGE